MKKIRKKPALLLYGASGIGVNLLNLMMASYLCSAVLTGGFGSDPVKIEHHTFLGVDLVVVAVWGAFQVIAKIIDGVIDIPMASFADSLKTRWGRRRPAIVIGLIPMIASYVMFMFPPDKGATMLNTIYLGVTLCVFYISYTLTMVTYYATFTEIVDNESDRMFMSNVKSVCDIFYFIIGYVLVVMLIDGLNVRTAGLIVLPLVLTMLIPLFMIKETKDSIGSTGKSESVNLFKSIAYTFKNKVFIIWMAVYSLMTFGVQLFLGGINEYFNNVSLSMIIVMACSFAPVPFTLILYNKLVKTKGFGFAFRYALLAFGAGMLMMFFVGLSPADIGVIRTVLAVVSGLLCSFAVGALFSVAYSVPSQLAAEEEEKTGISNSAMYFAVQGLFAGIASGIATGVVLTALKANDAEFGTMKFMTLICAVAMLVSFAVSFIIPKSLNMMGKKKNDKSKDK